VRSQFTEWYAGLADTVLSCKLNGEGSNPTWLIFRLHFTFNLISFLVDGLGLAGLGFSIRVSVTVQG